MKEISEKLDKILQILEEQKESEKEPEKVSCNGEEVAIEYEKEKDTKMKKDLYMFASMYSLYLLNAEGIGEVLYDCREELKEILNG